MMWNCDGLWSQGTWGGAGWIGLLSLSLVILAVVLFVVMLTRGAGRTLQASGPTAADAYRPLGPPAESPREILKRRYAAGEIDREEYLQRLGDL